MRYWWVNQNQTFEQEVHGGYLWSPKRKANRARNPFYEYMREVAPGDLVLSFQGTYIRAIGVAQSYAYECPKPAEFGSAGPAWDRVGWKVEVYFLTLTHQIRPADHLNTLVPHLSVRHAPLQKDGRGKQGVYLTELPPALMHALARLIGREAQDLMTANHAGEHVGSYGDGLVEWEEHLRREIERAPLLDDTEREQLSLARRGQGRFRRSVQCIEHACRVTGVDRIEHLRASHIRPWRDSDNEQRLDGENGLLLTPSIDHLFDRGFISFEDDGHLIVSPVAHRESLGRMGVPRDAPTPLGRFSRGQRAYLDYHRNEVLLRAQV